MKIPADAITNPRLIDENAALPIKERKYIEWSTVKGQKFLLPIKKGFKEPK
jgi:hypothetical protein